MKVRLLRDARIKHNAGEVVEVSSAEFNYLVSTNSAEPVVEEPAQAPAQDAPAKAPCRSGQRKPRERRADHAADTAPRSKNRAPD